MTPDGDCPITLDRPPVHLPQMEIVLLPQRGPLLIDPNGDCPFTLDKPWGDTPQTSPTQLIKPKCTETYYTKEALPT